MEKELEAATTEQDAWQALMDRVHLVASSSGLNSPVTEYLISLEAFSCGVVEDGHNIDDAFRVWFDEIVQTTSVWNLKDNWRDLGIAEIDINWKPGKKRGRDAWVPDGFNFKLCIPGTDDATMKQLGLDAQIKYTNSNA